jgi:AraC-like DNA-binding protein
MPYCEIRKIADVDEFIAAVRPASLELTVTERGCFAASVTRIRLHDLWVHRGQESLARIVRGEPIPGRTSFFFLTQPGQTSVQNGAELPYGRIVLRSSRDPYWHRSQGPIHWVAMSLPRANMVGIAASAPGHNLGSIEHEQIIDVPSSALNRLQQLHVSAGYLAKNAPEIITDLEAARGLEQALIQALIGCITVSDRPSEEPPSRRRRRLVVEQFRAVLKANVGQAIYLPEVCAALGVSDRTLRACCNEYLGVSPKLYLLMRRMHLARRALRETSGRGKTVTEIATSVGFWELGRFAVAYKALFGESPSSTLRQTSYAYGRSATN